MLADKMMIAVSYEGDDIERMALRELARRHKTTIGHLIREAVEALHGDELPELRSFYVAGDSVQKHQTGRGRGKRQASPVTEPVHER